MKKYVKPSVNLITSTDSEVGYKVWLNSRKNIVKRDGSTLQVGSEVFPDEQDYFNRIMKMGLQYNDIPTFVFEVVGSALFRDLLFNICKTGDWAVSNRFKFSLQDELDESNYPISKEYKGIPEWEAQFDKYMDACREDMTTDVNRLQMPYSISSSFWISMNLNTLISVLTFLKLKAPFFYTIYGKLFEKAVDTYFEKSDTLFKEVKIESLIRSEVGADISQYIRKDSNWKEDYSEIDDIVHLKIKMGLLLYSQFIRQKDTIIKGFFNEIIHDDEEVFKHKMFYSGTELKVTYIADKDKFLRTVRNRACNFAMSSGTGINSWSSIVDIVVKNMTTEEFMKILPCKFNKLPELETCPFYDDIKFRKEGVEKRNQICPILYKSYDLAKEKLERDEHNCLSQHYYNVVKKLNFDD